MRNRLYLPILLLLLLIIFPFLGAGPLHAESYREWEDSVEKGIKLEFEPYSDGRVRSYVSMVEKNPGGPHQVRWHVPARPLGGLIGSVRIRIGDADNRHCSVTVRFIYNQVLKKDLVPHGNLSEDLFWRGPHRLLNKESPLRIARHVETFKRKDLSSTTDPAIPLILPAVPDIMHSETFSGRDQMLSCLCEVRGNDDQVLLRSILVDAYTPCPSGFGRELSAWVMDEPEADRMLREYVGIRNIATIVDLPDAVSPYHEVDAVWISADAWTSQPLDKRLLRKLLLMGTQIYGREETAESIARTVGLPDLQTVLLGGVGLANKPLTAGKRSPWYTFAVNPKTMWSDRDTFIPEERHQDLGSETRVDLFASHERSFVLWTLLILGIYCFLVGVGTPVAFARLRGEKRLHLWWAVPTLATVLSLIAYGVGSIVVPRTTIADVTEYRLAYDNWPEVYCQSVVRVLSYEDRSIEFESPAKSFVLYGGQATSSQLEIDSQYALHEQDKSIYGVRGMRRGTILLREFSCFRQLTAPVSMVMEDGYPCLKALQDCRDVYVWETVGFRTIGKMSRGEVLHIEGYGRKRKIHGLPGRVWTMFYGLTGDDEQMFDTGGGVTVSEREEKGFDAKARAQTYDPFPNQWVVVAVTGDNPQARIVTNTIPPTKRIIWIVQMPMPQRTSPENGGRNDGHS